ncbi:Oidioi.mRNA.OKI2018_I69.chr1.g476.t1.cds [Oikopleura dioica]|uniref:Oidioi.mRNA.OKI2018_I69.chr1.g476.t1.cds n=1 Tax=Oikopleura dioica TaxID=34765 RepID=A0ABN7SJY2_OIKDI|nr:Oidioi.mRNA.OKI2018_I69.chr1.g476.t1.cds [Oikopleura dioica]
MKLLLPFLTLSHAASNYLEKSLGYVKITPPSNFTGLQARRPSSQYQGGRDTFGAETVDRNFAEPGLSVDDLDLGNRMPQPLRCNNPLVRGVVDSRIVGGYDAQREAWPFIVKIRIGCGGSIVSPSWIMTAAHCCRVSNLRFLDVTVSEYDRAGIDKNAETIQVDKVVIHPKFVPATLLNDICLLKLKKPIEFNMHAQPVCLPEKNSRIDQVKLGEGPLCYVAGWGRVGETEGTARILQETQVPIIPNKVCDAAYARNKVHEDEMMCAGYAEGGIDACQGDSGGPMICVENDQPVLRGVVSWGIGCARVGLYGVYTRTSSYIDWIRKTVNPNDQTFAELQNNPPATEAPPKSPKPTIPSGTSTIHPRCGDPTKKGFKIAKNVLVSCHSSQCDFKCPDGMRPSFAKAICNLKKRKFAPKKVKKTIHCIGDEPSEPPVQSSSGGFNSNPSPDVAAELNSGNAMTQCGNIVKKFRLDTSALSVDCKNDVCQLSCIDENMRPTLDKISCRVQGKKKKTMPKKAKVKCVVKQNSQAMRHVGSEAEETCGYMPIRTSDPVDYFCEGMECYFFCPNDDLKPTHDKITCNPKKGKWWPKRFHVFCQ